MDESLWLEHGNTFLHAVTNAEQVSVFARADEPTLEEIRKIIREEVQAALHPVMPGLPDVHHFLQVEATDEMGKRWKGILYGIEEEI